LFESPTGFLHFRLPIIFARKITTLENLPKAHNFLNAKNSFVLRQVGYDFAKDLELMGIGIQSDLKEAN
jgi:hypothetical protein